MTFKVLFRRAVSSFITIFLLMTLMFFIIHLAPGDPTLRYISPKMNTALISEIRKSFGLNENLFNQYFFFLKNIIKGNIGISYNYSVPVSSIISKPFMFTFVLASVALLVEVVIGLSLGLFAAKSKFKIIDDLLVKMNLILFATPSFVIGLMLLALFSYYLNIFPLAGIKSEYLSSTSPFINILDLIYHLILPVTVIVLSGLPVYFKYLRDSLLENMNSPYVKYLRVVGCSRNQIMIRHVLPNSLASIISIAGIDYGSLLTGTLITEVIFGLPGMGRLYIFAIGSRDYPLILGCTLVTGCAIILCNFIADLLKARLDKRLIKSV